MLEQITGIACPGRQACQMRTCIHKIAIHQDDGVIVQRRICTELLVNRGRKGLQCDPVSSAAIIRCLGAGSRQSEAQWPDLFGLVAHRKRYICAILPGRYVRLDGGYAAALQAL